MAKLRDILSTGGVCVCVCVAVREGLYVLARTCSQVMSSLVSEREGDRGGRVVVFVCCVLRPGVM